MAGMDLDGIVKDLNQRFAKELPEYYRRRILFWQDEEGEFADRIADIHLEDAKLLVLTETNHFAAKKLLSVDDTESNYLVYSALPTEPAEEDWLLPVKLYSETFRADLLSMWMEELALPQTADFRRLVKVYKKFFAAAERRAAFKKLDRGITTAAQMHLTVMAAICHAPDAEPASILRAVISGGLSMEENGAYQGLVTYGAEATFRMLVAKATGYAKGEDGSLEGLARHIFLTATTRTLAREYLAGLDEYISMAHQTWCYDFVSQWLGEAKKEGLYGLLRHVEEALSLRERLQKVPVEDLVETELFPCVHECILARVMREIGDHIIDVDAILRAVEKRRSLAWYEGVSCYYEGILQVAKMQAFSLEHAAGFHIVEARNVWKAYAEDYYRMDTCYRRYHLAFGKSLKAGNEYLDDLFKQVTERVEGLYTQGFLKALGENWSTVCAEELATEGHIAGVSQQVDFYRKKVETEENRVFVIISDAFRYELAVSLAEDLRRETQCRVSLEAWEGIFPTITKFGMAALLPHRELTIHERDGGDLQVLADGRATDANYRDRILKGKNVSSVALKYRDLVAMKRAERLSLVKGMHVVYIYHDKVDEESHGSDAMVFPACEEAIAEIKEMMRIIRNDFSGVHIYVTADHGFLYTYSPLSEDAKVDKTSPGELDVEVDRRYLITRKGAMPDHLLPVKFIDDGYDAFAPRGNVRIKKKGGGLNFVHGGISLQEMVVPVLDYRYVRNDSKDYQRNRARYDTKPVEVALLSSSRKVSNMIFSLDFYQKEPVGDNRTEAKYVVYFADATGKPVSDMVKIIADKTGSDGEARLFRCHFNLKPMKYDNRAAYSLVIADAEGKRPSQKEEFQIDIAFAADEFDFFG